MKGMGGVSSFEPTSTATVRWTLTVLPTIGCEPLSEAEAAAITAAAEEGEQVDTLGRRWTFSADLADELSKQGIFT